MKKEIKNLQETAWELLEKKGLTTGERMNVRTSFASTYKEEYPFIKVVYNKGEVEYYHSEHVEISRYMFKKESEVILANAIYENIKDRFNPNEFTQLLKFNFRLLNISNEWTD